MKPKKSVEVATQGVIDAAIKIDSINSKRANVLLNDKTLRIDHENTLGFGLDRLRLALDEYHQAINREKLP